MTNVIERISNGVTLDISQLSIDELRRLHYEEEIFTAEKAKRTRPFSKERNDLLARGYGLVATVMRELAVRQDKTFKAMGAKYSYCNLLARLVEQKKASKKKEGKIIFFEAGVGTGMVASYLSDREDVIAKGCDFLIDPGLKNSSRLELIEADLLEALKRVDDASIDIFYSNDVFEHILDDEMGECMKQIRKKLSPDGIVVTITPNPLSGPHDISRLYLPVGSKAKGFHFHEYTYGEISQLFRSHGFRVFQVVLCNPFTRNFFGLQSPSGIRIVEFLRHATERLSPLLWPNTARKIVLAILGHQVTIFTKQDVAVHGL